MTLPAPDQFQYNVVASKVALSAGIGLLVGLEREWARKEIGVRTFAIAGLLGMLTSLLDPLYVAAALLAILVMIGFLNAHSLLRDRSLELTTSVCLVVTFFLGALVGQSHYFTAATSAIVVVMLLAWKLELERLAGALRPEEIRGAVLLGLLSVVVYPLLPDHFVDAWGLLNPQQAWVTVV
ncbi:MAG: magnesium transporter accessory protein, partial [Phycisphaerales bacterium]|nr:magnesium transporter accessory protein [Phycisphaerales bacterium]